MAKQSTMSGDRTNPYQSPDYNPYAITKNSDGSMVQSPTQTTDVMQPLSKPIDYDKWQSPDYNPYAQNRDEGLYSLTNAPDSGTVEGFPEISYMQPPTGFDTEGNMVGGDVPAPTTQPMGDAATSTMPEGGMGGQPTYQQPNYAAQQPVFEAFTPPDPAANTPTGAETAASLGGGATVNTDVGNAESFLNANRDLNAISTGEDARAAAEDAIYGSMASRLDPRFEQSAKDLEISLRNRGLSEGDAAFDSAMANFGREKTDAYNQAMWQSVMGGGAEAQRNQQMDLDRRAQMFGEALGMSQQEIDKNRNALQAQAAQNQYALGMAGINQAKSQADRLYDLQSQAQGFGQQMTLSQYQNQMRQQQIQEEMLRRNQSLNELNALLTGSQVSQPNFSGYNQAGNAGGVDYSGAAQNQYQSTLDSFNANNAMWQGMMGGVSNMYGAGMFG